MSPTALKALCLNVAHTLHTRGVEPSDAPALPKRKTRFKTCIGLAICAAGCVALGIQASAIMFGA